VFRRDGAWQVEVVTDVHCYGAGATCGDLKGFQISAVLYYQAMSLMCFPYLAASLSLDCSSLVFCLAWFNRF
jgi:hypothetical protein